jgi:hypothetical protein
MYLRVQSQKLKTLLIVYLTILISVPCILKSVLSGLSRTSSVMLIHKALGIEFLAELTERFY